MPSWDKKAFFMQTELAPIALGSGISISDGPCGYSCGLGSEAFEQMIGEGIGKNTALRAQAKELAYTKTELFEQLPISLFHLKAQKRQFTDKVTNEVREEETLVSPEFGPISKFTDAGEHGTGTADSYTKILERANKLARTEGSYSMMWISPGEPIMYDDGVFIPEARAYLWKKDPSGEVTAYQYLLTGSQESLSKMMRKLGYQGNETAVENNVICRNDLDSDFTHKEVFSAFESSLSPLEKAVYEPFIDTFRIDARISDEVRLEKMDRYQDEFERKLTEAYQDDMKAALEHVVHGLMAIATTPSITNQVNISKIKQVSSSQPLLPGERPGYDALSTTGEQSGNYHAVSERNVVLLPAYEREKNKKREFIPELEEKDTPVTEEDVIIDTDSANIPQVAVNIAPEESFPHLVSDLKTLSIKSGTDDDRDKTVYRSEVKKGSIDKQKNSDRDVSQQQIDVIQIPSFLIAEEDEAPTSQKRDGANTETSTNREDIYQVVDKNGKREDQQAIPVDGEEIQKSTLITALFVGIVLLDISEQHVIHNRDDKTTERFALQQQDTETEKRVLFDPGIISETDKDIKPFVIPAILSVISSIVEETDEDDINDQITPDNLLRNLDILRADNNDSFEKEKSSGVQDVFLLTEEDAQQQNRFAELVSEIFGSIGISSKKEQSNPNDIVDGCQQQQLIPQDNHPLEFGLTLELKGANEVDLQVKSIFVMVGIDEVLSMIQSGQENSVIGQEQNESEKLVKSSRDVVKISRYFIEFWDNNNKRKEEKDVFEEAESTDITAVERLKVLLNIFDNNRVNNDLCLLLASMISREILALGIEHEEQFRNDISWEINELNEKLKSLDSYLSNIEKEFLLESRLSVPGDLRKKDQVLNLVEFVFDFPRYHIDGIVNDEFQHSPLKNSSINEKSRLSNDYLHLIIPQIAQKLGNFYIFCLLQLLNYDKSEQLSVLSALRVISEELIMINKLNQIIRFTGEDVGKIIWLETKPGLRPSVGGQTIRYHNSKKQYNGVIYRYHPLAIRDSNVTQ